MKRDTQFLIRFFMICILNATAFWIIVSYLLAGLIDTGLLIAISILIACVIWFTHVITRDTIFRDIRGKYPNKVDDYIEEKSGR